MLEKVKLPVIEDHSQWIEAVAYLALVQTHEAHSTQVAHFFKKHGLSSQQYNALRIVWARAGRDGIPSLAVAQRLLNRVPDITRLLDRLERKGWISRHRSSRDRRVVLVKLTAAGLALLEEVDAPLVQLQRDNFNHMSHDELRQLIDLLARARQIPGVTL